MKQKTFIQTSGAIFAVVAVVHLSRLVLGWQVTLGNWQVPMWMSLVGIVVGGYLAYNAYRISK